MTVWIENVIFQNFILDGSFLFLAQKTMRVKIGKIRLFIASLLGAAFALFFPLFTLPDIAVIIVKFLFGILLCLTGTRAKGVRTNVLVILFFYLYAVSYGGILYALYDSVGAEEREKHEFVFAAVALVPFFILICLISARTLYKRFAKRKLFYLCKIRLGENIVETRGLYDTGNGLTYKENPVCVLSSRLAERLTKGEQTEEGTVYVKTAVGAEYLKVFRAELQIYSESGRNIIDKVYFASSPGLSGKEYELILQPQVCKEE